GSTSISNSYAMQGAYLISAPKRSGAPLQPEDCHSLTSTFTGHDGAPCFERLTERPAAKPPDAGPASIASRAQRYVTMRSAPPEGCGTGLLITKIGIPVKRNISSASPFRREPMPTFPGRKIQGEM